MAQVGEEGGEALAGGCVEGEQLREGGEHSPGVQLRHTDGVDEDGQLERRVGGGGRREGEDGRLQECSVMH